MAGVETIIVGGGIQAGSPFQLNFIPYITAVTPPQVQSSPIMAQVTGATQGIVIAAGGVDPQPAATEVLRVRGGAIFEKNAINQLVIGKGATPAGASPDMIIGTGAVATASCTIVGQNATCGGNSQTFGSAASIGAAANGCVNVGGNIIGAGSNGCITMGTGINIAGGILSAVVIGSGTLQAGASNTTSINGGNVGTSSNCILINAGGEGFGGGNNVCRLGSAANRINLMVIGGEIGTGLASLVIRTSNAQGADAAGRPLTLQPGMSTGTGSGADLFLATGAQVGAGSTLQVSTPRLRVHGNTGQVEVLAPTGGVAFLVRGFANQAAMQINADAGGPGVMIDFNTTDTVGGGGAGTLTNAPHAGDPDVWIPVSLGGVKYRMPMWLA